jgi:2-hydroxychromene-2-carboxylate isomerase
MCNFAAPHAWTSSALFPSQQHERRADPWFGHPAPGVVVLATGTQGPKIKRNQMRYLLVDLAHEILSSATTGDDRRVSLLKLQTTATDGRD